MPQIIKQFKIKKILRDLDGIKSVDMFLISCNNFSTVFLRIENYKTIGEKLFKKIMAEVFL